MLSMGSRGLYLPSGLPVLENDGLRVAMHEAESKVEVEVESPEVEATAILHPKGRRR